MKGAEPVVLRARGLGKRYAGVVALERVDLELRAGEVHAIVGENGAGKSTLLRILGGVEPPDHGSLELADATGELCTAHLRSVRGAMAAGIALVHQELNLAENLDVAGALFLGREPQRWGVMNLVQMRREARRWLGAVGLDVDPGTPCGSLSIAHRQLVEIARALSTQARILVLDEPTSCLSARETERLLTIIDGLRAQGVAIALVSHHLEEVLQIADGVTVLRDGQVVGVRMRGGFDRADLERMMVGRDIPACSRRPPHSDAPARLRTVALVSRHRRSHAVSIAVRPGEIVGLAGLMGSGRTELLEAIAGIVPHAGRAELDGAALDGPAWKRASRGVALVPEDRARNGLFLPDAVSRNVSVAWIGMRGKPWVIRRRAEATAIGAAIRRVGLRPLDPTRVVGTLSGGNQQKTLLARWTVVEPRLLLLDEPTRGVDVAARAEIHNEVRRLADSGAAVLFASSELEEILLLADRIVVMHDGAVAGELAAHDATELAIMRLATGGAAGRAT